MNKYFYLICLLFTFNFSEAQYIRCATYEVHKAAMESDAQYRAYYENIMQKMHAWQAQGSQERVSSATSTIVVPVVVHIVWNTDEQNISDAQVLSQIEVLNEDYAGKNANRIDVPNGFQSRFGNVNLSFCLATRTPNGDWTTGIERRQTSIDSFNVGDGSLKYTSSGGLDGWDETQYLNIWVCNLTSPLGNILGYTEMPGGAAALDGCVILYSSFGRGSSFSLLPQYNLGRTATHEVGHWLGLFHVWGDDYGACWGTDYIDDTPDQANWTFGCPSYPDIDSCAYSVDEDGIPGDPVNGIMYMNYLDYSDDDCMSMFTVDQVAVMHGVLNDSSFAGRLSIQTSMGCSPPTGIAEVNAATFIDLYPNPANGMININFRLPSTTVLSVSAYDMLGKELITSEVNKTGEQNINLDVSSLSSGLYMLVVKTDQGNIAKNLSIAH